MAKQTPAASSPHVVIADGEPLNLQNRYVAAVLAWIIPGAGHFYQRRYFKAWIFSISVLSCFVIGVFIADGKCVYASWQGPEKRWQFVLQAGAGLPTFPAMVQAWHARGKVARTPLWNGFMAAPMDTAELDEWHHDTASGFDMGTLYTMIAGLLNMLVIFDAYAGPLPPPTPRPKNKPVADSGGEAKST